ncbi:MAG: hypothetical protein R3Y54_11850 [Eubacteriales bacterium]
MRPKFSLIEGTLELNPDADPLYQETVNLLKSIDFNTVDALIMSYSQLII